MNSIFPNSWDDDPIWRTHIFRWGWNHQLANGEKADLSIVNGGYKPTNRIKEAELELHPQVLNPH